MTYIRLKDVSLQFPLYGASSFREGIVKFIRPGTHSFAPPKSVLALNNITLDIKEGDRIGLIGLNGSGKSSFLRLTAGIYQPTQGIVHRQGSVATLFDLGLGMDDEATGYDNIKIAGATLGIKSCRAKELISDIEDFTELNDALARPIKTYSAGMRVRLAFSLITTFHREILLIDEIVGVGDAVFLEKASNRIKAQSKYSKILILASHAEFVLRDFCNKGLVFQEGKIVKFAPIEDAISHYNYMTSNVGERINL